MRISQPVPSQEGTLQVSNDSLFPKYPAHLVVSAPIVLEEEPARHGMWRWRLFFGRQMVVHQVVLVLMAQDDSPLLARAWLEGTNM